MWKPIWTRSQTSNATRNQFPHAADLEIHARPALQIGLSKRSNRTAVCILVSSARAIAPKWAQNCLTLPCLVLRSAGLRWYQRASKSRRHISSHALRSSIQKLALGCPGCARAVSKSPSKGAQNGRMNFARDLGFWAGP